MSGRAHSRLRGMVPPDPEGGVSAPACAVVRVTGRRRRRFAAGCVRLFADEAQAVAAAEPAAGEYAARVTGPSKSSEGQYVYYLLEWLGPDP